MTAILVLLAVLYAEAVTEIFVASALFSGFRDYVSRRGGLIAEFVHCGYCVSVWVSVTVVWALPRLIVDHPIDMGFRVFIVHRLANVLHELWSRWFHRVPWQVVVNRVDGNYQPPIPQTLESPVDETKAPLATAQESDSKQPS